MGQSLNLIVSASFAGFGSSFDLLDDDNPIPREDFSSPGCLACGILAGSFFVLADLTDPGLEERHDNKSDVTEPASDFVSPSTGLDLIADVSNEFPVKGEL